MRYYNKFLMHEDKRDKGMNSTTSAKGTDGKKNNSSEYNHAYYEGHKEKWKDNKKSSSKKKNANKSDDDDLFYDEDGKARFGHKDFDPNDPDFKRTDGEKIEGTNLRTFTNANGSTIILGDGIKFSFPPGTKITKDLAKRIAKVEGGSKEDKEQYVARMLNAVTGFADKQKLSVDDNKKKKKYERLVKHMDDDYLEHHGVKGMKWGVRRYQNYGGTYTQAGMNRYRDAEAKYDKADARYKDAKAKLKAARRNDDYQGTVSAKAEVTQAKLNRKMAKANLEKHYDHLKQDKLGDQGKLMYASGKTITGDKSVTNALASVGAVAASAAIYGHTTGLIRDKRITAALAAVGGLSYAAAVGKGVKDEYEAKRLRAYYGHTSNY